MSKADSKGRTGGKGESKVRTQTPRLAPRTRSGPDDGVTARPKSIQEEFSGYERDREEGLSLDPEDMGMQFLERATEEGDHTTRLPDAEAFDVSSSPRSDSALVGPNYEATDDVWENTVNLTMQDGREGSSELSPPTVSSLDREQGNDEAPYEPVDVRDVDLTGGVVREASLFDHENEALGEVEEPEVRTDEARSRQQPSGPVTPERRRAPG